MTPTLPDDPNEPSLDETLDLTLRVLTRAESLGRIPAFEFAPALAYLQDRRRAYIAAGSPYGAHYCGLLLWLDEGADEGEASRL